MATFPALRFAPLLMLALLPATPVAAPGPQGDATELQLAQCPSLQSSLNRQSQALADLQARTRISASQRELERLRHAHQIEQLQNEKRQLAYVAAIAILVLLLGLATGFGLLLRKRHGQLRRLSEVDALTGLNNRHAATAALNAMALQPGPEGTRHVLFLIDVDHFKQINDGHGHLVGDQVLRQFALSLQGSLRASDLLARYGGEEFLLVLPYSDEEAAVVVLQRLLAEVARLPMAVVEGRPIHVTFSAGVAVQNGNHARFDNVVAMLQAADGALYAAKRGGRNRVHLHRG